MDMTTCLKSLLLAIQEYRGGRTAQSAAQLLKQVKVSGAVCLTAPPRRQGTRPGWNTCSRPVNQMSNHGGLTAVNCVTL